MTGKILKWIENEADKNLRSDSKNSGFKAAGLGVLEGLVDAAVVVGTFGLIYTWGSGIKDLFSKK